MEDREHYHQYSFEEFNQALAALRNEIEAHGTLALLHEEDVALLLHYHQAMLQVVQLFEPCSTCTQHIDLTQARAHARTLDQQRQQYANDLTHVDALALEAFMQSCGAPQAPRAPLRTLQHRDAPPHPRPVLCDETSLRAA